MSHTLRESLGIDWALHALITEVTRLEELYKKLGSEDRSIVRDCSIRLNQLVLKKIREDRVLAC